MKACARQLIKINLQRSIKISSVNSICLNFEIIKTIVSLPPRSLSLIFMIEIILVVSHRVSCESYQCDLFRLKTWKKLATETCLFFGTGLFCESHLLRATANIFRCSTAKLQDGTNIDLNPQHETPVCVWVSAGRGKAFMFCWLLRN